MNHIIQLELNTTNIMIFIVNIKPRGTAIILYEDKRRRGELFRDFPFLYPNYYKSEAEWDDYRNLIKATIFVFSKENLENKEIKDSLLSIAESMIEFKPAVNPSIEFIFDEKVCEFYYEKDKNYNRFITHILSFSENSNNCNVLVEDLNNLTQKLIENK